MTLTIQRLVTRAKIPRALNADAALVDQVARERFRVECARQSDRPWPVPLGVVRIRKLRVQVTVTPLQLKPDALAAAWVAAFLRELSIALAYPSGVGPFETVHFETRAEYLAAIIRDVMTGVAAQRWEYGEFETSLHLGAMEAVLGVLSTEPSEIIPTLLILERWGALDRFLALGNEAGLQRLIGMVDLENGVRDDGLSIDDLIVVGRLLSSHRRLLGDVHPSGGSSHLLRSHDHLGACKLALKLFVLWRQDPGWQNAGPDLSPRKALNALKALAAFLRFRELMVAASERLKRLRLMLTGLTGRLSDWSSRKVFDHPSCERRVPPATGENATGPIRASEELIPAVSSESCQPGTTELLHRFATVVTAIRTESAELVEELMSAMSSGDDQPGSHWRSIIVTGNSVSVAELARILDQPGLFNGSNPAEFQVAEFCNVLTAACNGNRSEVAARLASVLSSDAGAPGIRFWKTLTDSGSAAGRNPLAETLETLRAAVVSGGWRDIAELMEQLASALAGGQNPVGATALEQALATTTGASRSELTRLLDYLRTAAGTGNRTELAKSLQGLRSASGGDAGWTKLTELLEQLRAATGTGSWSELAELLEGMRVVAGRSAGWAELAELVEQLRKAAGSAGFSELANGLEHLLAAIGSTGRSLPARPSFDALRGAAGIPEGRDIPELLEQLAAALADVQSQTRVAEPTIISTGCTGLFFLIRILDRLEWLDRLTRSGLGAEYGPRTITYTLAGLALAVLDRFDEKPRYLDPGLALFCGWLDEPDLAGLRSFFASEPFRKRRDLLTVLLENEIAEGSSDSWKACFDALATQVIQELAGRIRGFGRASRSYVLKNFVALPGRICVEETRLEVLVAASPLNLVLHLSGMDYPVEAVTWLAGRRVEFQLEGL